MGILDGYPFDFSGNRTQAPFGSGILGLLSQQLPPNDKVPTTWPGALPPASRADVSPAGRAPAAPSPAPEEPNPFMRLLNGIGSLFGGGSSAATPAAPQPVHQAAPGPSFLDRLTAGATNFTTGGNPIAGLLNSINGIATGQRTDATGILLQQRAATYRALLQAGVPPAVAQAAALNPTVLHTIAPQLYGKPAAERASALRGRDSTDSTDRTR